MPANAKSGSAIYGTSTDRIFSSIEASRCALLVIDMQNYFVDPQYPTAVVSAAATVPAINRMADLLRIFGGCVIWIRTLSSTDESRWSVFEDHILTPQARSLRQVLLHPDHHASKLIEGLDCRSQDKVVYKTRFSALAPQSSNLLEVLAGQNIETVLIAGTATNVCCESTAKDATVANYKSIMIEDCLSAHTEDAHKHSLANFRGIFGDVLTVNQCAALLSKER
ncbi:cysteine hydrolase [Pelagibacterium sp. H642]|uniref:cysteine hydrolase family protein n=1 Tax=Pelagibacterium sp. H642 TaxID=1881069 RepID=UPI002814DB4E|nr:cysteine hydrolase [Pelagibacterium sp. H642]WMT89363.1 cysteine hydrolase [Pelagibacterium sp. H642]